MNDRPTVNPTARRGFLRAAFAIAGGTVAAKALGGKSSEPVAPAASAPEPEAGYRESAHVKRYYETARL